MSQILTNEIQDQIITHIKHGLPPDSAAIAAGVPVRVFHQWVQKGMKSKSGKYRRFVDDIEKAQAEMMSELLTSIHEYAKNDWRAASWILERRFPDRWGHWDQRSITKDPVRHPYRVILNKQE